MNVALDTNVLAYAEGTNGVPMKELALHVLGQLPPESTFIPMQTLGELFSVLVRKAGRSRAERRLVEPDVVYVTITATRSNPAITSMAAQTASALVGCAGVCNDSSSCR